jgi:hypothetical protein
MPEGDKKSGDSWKRNVRDFGCFVIGAYLLVHTPSPSTIQALAALALMGVLPWSIIEQWINRNGNGKR